MTKMSNKLYFGDLFKYQNKKLSSYHFLEIVDRIEKCGGVKLVLEKDLSVKV